MKGFIEITEYSQGNTRKSRIYMQVMRMWDYIYN